MIKWVYLIHRLDPNRYFHFESVRPGSNCNEGVFHIPSNFIFMSLTIGFLGIIIRTVFGRKSFQSATI